MTTTTFTTISRSSFHVGILLLLSIASTASAQSPWKSRYYRQMDHKQRQSQHGWGKTSASGEHRFGEIRTRTYREGTVYHAQVQANAHRAGLNGRVEGGRMPIGRATFHNPYAEGGFETRTGVSAQAQGGLNLGKDPNIGGRASTFAGIRVDAEGEAGTSYKGVEFGVNGSAEASAGASANAEANVGREGLKANAGAFAGARAGATGGGNIQGIGAEGTAEAWVGAGAEADATATYKNGKLRVGGKLGAGAGYGGKLGGDITIDTDKVAAGATRAYNSKAGQTVKKEVVKFGKNAGRDTKRAGNTITKQANTAKKQAKNLGNATKKAAKKLKFW